MTQLEQLAEYAAALEGTGFLTEEPPASTWPDLVSVAIYSDDDDPDTVAFVLLCANQCARDRRHDCGVSVPLVTLLAHGWPALVGQAIPWMVLGWGPHLHQLPFCSVKCLVEFVERRASDGGMRRNGHH